MTRTPDAAFIERAVKLYDSISTTPPADVDALLADALKFGDDSPEMAHALAVQGRLARWSQQKLKEGADALDRALQLAELHGFAPELRARWNRTLCVTCDDIGAAQRALDAALRANEISQGLRGSMDPGTIATAEALVHTMRAGLFAVVPELRELASIWPKLSEVERKLQLESLQRFAQRRTDLPPEEVELLGKLTAEPQGIAGVLPPPEPKADAAELAKVLAELDALVGLRDVKAELHRLTAMLQVEEMRRAAGLPVGARAHHFVFLGPPGTGKTTVARLLGRLFKALGLLARGHVVEVDRAGLVAGYVGQTAIKVEAAVASAMDGVLFVDEAYALFNASDNDFGHEAVATLLKRMEDDRARLVVVLAGYDEPMARMLQMNPGLRSRVTTTLHFRTYGADDLTTIFQRQAETAGYCPTAAAVRRVREICALMQGSEDPATFGNAREIRNLFEDTMAQQAARLVARAQAGAPPTAEELQCLEPGDIFWDELGDDSLRDTLAGEALRTVAVHELGHALVGYCVAGPPPVLVTTIPSGQTLGRAFFDADESVTLTRAQLLGRAARALAGRASEEVVFGVLTSGAARDLEVAERVALELLRTGMSEETTHAALEEYAVTDDAGRGNFRNERTRQEVGELLQEAYALALKIVREREAALRLAVDRLVERRTLTREELAILFGPRPVARAPWPRATSEAPDERGDPAAGGFGHGGGIPRARAGVRHESAARGGARPGSPGGERGVLPPRLRGAARHEGGGHGGVARPRRGALGPLAGLPRHRRAEARRDARAGPGRRAQAGAAGEEMARRVGKSASRRAAPAPGADRRVARGATARHRPAAPGDVLLRGRSRRRARLPGDGPGGEHRLLRALRLRDVPRRAGPRRAELLHEAEAGAPEVGPVAGDLSAARVGRRRRAIPLLGLAAGALLAGAFAAASPPMRAADLDPGRAPAFEAPLAFAPLDTPLTVTGGFGEYRIGHFHAGFDFGTGGRTGRPVRAVLEGHLERVRASGVGYGRSLYLRTRDGRLIQFGHLDAYMPAVAAWVDSIQSAGGQYEQDLWPAATRFPVRAGQTIAWTGQSGAGGPHLHFEIRRGDTALQPERAGLSVRDASAPTLVDLTLEPLDDSSSVAGRFAAVTLAFGARPDTVRVLGRVRAVVGARDGVWKGVDRMVPWLTRLEWGDTWLECRMDSISWATDMSESDYVYDAGRVVGQKGLVLWAPAGWRPKFIVTNVPRAREAGTLVVRAGDAPRVLRLIARDVTGNATTRDVVVVPDGAAPRPAAAERTPAAGEPLGAGSSTPGHAGLTPAALGERLRAGELGITLPADALFEGMLRLAPARGRAAPPASAGLVPVRTLGEVLPRTTPLRRAFTLHVPRSAATGALAADHVGLYRDGPDGWERVGWTPRPDGLGWDAESRYPGRFALFADTLAPRVQPRAASGGSADGAPYSTWALEAELDENRQRRRRARLLLPGRRAPRGGRVGSGSRRAALAAAAAARAGAASRDDRGGGPRGQRAEARHDDHGRVGPGRRGGARVVAPTHPARVRPAPARGRLRGAGRIPHATRGARARCVPRRGAGEFRHRLARRGVLQHPVRRADRRGAARSRRRPAPGTGGYPAAAGDGSRGVRADRPGARLRLHLLPVDHPHASRALLRQRDPGARPDRGAPLRAAAAPGSAAGHVADRGGGRRLVRRAPRARRLRARLHDRGRPPGAAGAGAHGRRQPGRRARAHDFRRRLQHAGGGRHAGRGRCPAPRRARAG